MTIETRPVTITSILFFEVLLLSIFIVVTFFVNQVSFGFGLLISLCNTGIYYGLCFYHKRLISRYPMQALVVVASSTVVRFLLIGGLLVLCFQQANLTAKALVLGFVLGQLFFLIHHLMVASSNVK